MGVGPVGWNERRTTVTSQVRIEVARVSQETCIRPQRREYKNTASSRTTIIALRDRGVSETFRNVSVGAVPILPSKSSIIVTATYTLRCKGLIFINLLLVRVLSRHNTRSVHNLFFENVTIYDHIMYCQ